MNRRPAGGGVDPALVVLAVLMTVLFGALSYLARVIVAHDPTTPTLIAGCVLVGFGLSLAATVVIAGQRKRALTRITADQITAVITGGALPDRANVRRWRGLLEQRRRWDSRLRWIAPLVGVGLGALAAAAALTDHPSAYLWWPACGVSVVVGALNAVTAQREMPRIDTLLAELDTIGSQDSGGGAPDEERARPPHAPKG